MAIDSKLKKYSAISFLLPFMTPASDSDGAFSLADKQAAVWVYSGIEAGEVVVVTHRDKKPMWKHRRRRMAR